MRAYGCRIAVRWCQLKGGLGAARKLNHFREGGYKCTFGNTPKGVNVKLGPPSSSGGERQRERECGKGRGHVILNDSISVVKSQAF
jgi:hypothetical protein